MSGIFPGNSSLIQQLDSAYPGGGFFAAFGAELASIRGSTDTNMILSRTSVDGPAGRPPPRWISAKLRPILSRLVEANIILEDTFERHVAGGLFCDIELGLNIIRGDNIVLLGELDSDKERDQPHMKRVELEEVLEAEERLNEEGNTSVRQQWDFEQQH
ncbi:Sm-like protein LSM1A [Phytophthora citrophthora]|uniref:Sm-like protein LSM1A n=1 Tax=Phytophthora citrophthora TaxID=4793 RepID=A0AAD9LQE6_9STRA|nr:Sm-like protein LSM1A [Phytophthora citrophthora]